MPRKSTRLASTKDKDTTVIKKKTIPDKVKEKDELKSYMEMLEELPGTVTDEPTPIKQHVRQLLDEKKPGVDFDDKAWALMELIAEKMWDNLLDLCADRVEGDGRKVVTAEDVKEAATRVLPKE